jgi:hypothetical protein
MHALFPQHWWLIAAIAENIAQIVERDWAEIETRKCRNKIEELIKQK